jgi:copper chaperone
MFTFKVNDMTCGHCVSLITKAIKDVDSNAKVEVKLDQQMVLIYSTRADVQMLQNAMIDAGYSPEII